MSNKKYWLNVFQESTILKFRRRDALIATPYIILDEIFLLFENNIYESRKLVGFFLLETLKQTKIYLEAAAPPLQLKRKYNFHLLNKFTIREVPLIVWHDGIFW